MAALGGINSTTDLSTKAMRSGTISLIITDLSKDVTFASAMPNTSYRLFFQVEGNLTTVCWASSKLTTGFTLNLSAGVVGNVSYMAVSD